MAEKILRVCLDLGINEQSYIAHANAVNLSQAVMYIVPPIFCFVLLSFDEPENFEKRG